MKKVIFISFLFFSCVFTANAQWQQVLKGASGPLYSYQGNLICVGNNYLYISTDTGNTWKVADSNSDLKNAWLFTSIDSLLFTGTIFSKIYVSTDSGKTWKPVAPYPVPIECITGSGNNLLAGGDPDSMYLSTDYGKHWMPSSKGLPHPTQYSGNNYFSFVNMGNATLVFYSNTSYITYDHGLTWHYKAKGYPPSYNITVFGDDIFEAQNGNIFRSGDSSLSWSTVLSGGFDMGGICTDGHYILASDLNLGVIMSKDSGNSWGIINNGLPNQDFTSVAILDSYIFCSTYLSPGQVFRMSLSEAVAVPETLKYINSVKAAQPNLLGINVYPDPVKHSATVDFGRQLQNGNMQLFNVAGQRVRYIDQITDQKIILQPNNLPAGTYTYIVSEQETQLAAGKLIIQ